MKLFKFALFLFMFSIPLLARPLVPIFHSLFISSERSTNSFTFTEFPIEINAVCLDEPAEVGIYYISEISFLNATNVTIKLQVDDIDMGKNKTFYKINHTSAIYFFQKAILDKGIHTVQMRYRTVNGWITLYNTQYIIGKLSPDTMPTHERICK